MANDFALREVSRWMRPDAHRFLQPDWRRHVTAGSEAEAVFSRYEQKWRVDQLRDWHGRFADEGLQKISGTENDVGQTPAVVEEVAKEAEKIAAGGRTGYLRCLDVCSPLLERFQKPGSDRNQWDFHKCMNICLGR